VFRTGGKTQDAIGGPDGGIASGRAGARRLVMHLNRIQMVIGIFFKKKVLPPSIFKSEQPLPHEKTMET
jgi:hypothetical protein